MENNEATAKAEFCQRVLSGEIEWVAATIWLDGLTLDEQQRLYHDCIVHNAVEKMYGGKISERRNHIAEYLEQRVEAIRSAVQSQQQRAAEYLEQRVEAMQQDIRDDPTHTGEYLEQRVEAIRSAVQSQQQRAAEYLEQRIKNKEQQQRPKVRKGKDGEIWSEQQQQSDKPKPITGLCNIASYLCISVNTLRTAINNGRYKGIIYRVGNSKWQLDTEKYEQSKYNQL